MDQLLERGRALVRRSLDDDIAGMSAELAYRFLFALFPFMIFLSASGGFVASWLSVPDPATRVLTEARPEDGPTGEAVVQDRRSPEDAAPRPVPATTATSPGTPTTVPARIGPGWPMVLPATLVGIAMAVGAFLGAASERLLPRDD